MVPCHKWLGAEVSRFAYTGFRCLKSSWLIWTWCQSHKSWNTAKQIKLVVHRPRDIRISKYISVENCDCALLTFDQVPTTQCESPLDRECSQSGFWHTLERMTLVGMGEEHEDSAAFVVNAEFICCLHTIPLVWVPRPQLTEQGLQSVIVHLKI